jgi:hypothetical protein
MWEAASRGFRTLAVCVVFVQMTEAWLLFNEDAIWFAVGNSNGKNLLNLPELSEIEQILNPKDSCFRFCEASGLTARRLKFFCQALTAFQIDADFSPCGVCAFLDEKDFALRQNAWT